MRNIQSLSPPVGYLPAWRRPDQNLVSPRRETEIIRHASCDVVFGSPSADCMGTGICRISARQNNPVSGSKSRNCQHTQGLLFPIEGGKSVALVLTRALLCSKLYKTHLRSGILILEQPCQLPEEMIKMLGLKITAFPVGQYRVQESDHFLRIDFK